MSVRIRRVICPVTLISAERAAKVELPLAVTRPFPAAQAQPLPAAGPTTSGEEESAGTTARRFGSARMPTYPSATGPGRVAVAGVAGPTAVPQRHGLAHPPIRPLASPAPPESAGLASRSSAARVPAIPIATPVPIQATGAAALPRRGSVEMAVLPVASPVARGLAIPPSVAKRQAFQASLAVRLEPPIAGRDQEPPGSVQKKRSLRPAGLPPFGALTPATIRSLASVGDSGARLGEEHLAAIRPVLGEGLPDVRVHTGEAAAATAEALGAEAFTVGRDIFFARGRFDPTSPRGRALLAHELTHARQQAGLGAGRVLGYGGEAGEAEAEAAERAVLGGGPGEGRLTVGRYVRNYASADGRPISPEDKARLDAISHRALEVCRQLLGSEVVRTSEEFIRRLQIDLSLDLASLTDEQAAWVWGKALAAAIRRELGLGDEMAWLRRAVAEAETVQLSPAEPDPAEVKKNVALLRRALAICDDKPQPKVALSIVLTHIMQRPPDMANAILREIQKWTVGGITGPAVLSVIMSPIDEMPGVARVVREQMYKKGITEFQVGQIPLTPEEKALMAKLSSAKGLVEKLRAWEEAKSKLYGVTVRGGPVGGTVYKSPLWERRLVEIEAQLVAYLPAVGVGTIQDLAKAVRTIEDRFKEKAQLVAIRMLDANEKLVFGEAARYAGVKAAGGQSDAAELIQAAKELWPIRAELSGLEATRAAYERAAKARDPWMGTEERAAELRGSVEAKRKELSIMTDLYALKFPVLKAPGLDLRSLANAKPEQVERLLKGPFTTVLESIAKTRRNIVTGKLTPLTLPAVIQETKAELGIAKGSPLEAIADDAVKRAQADATLKNIALAALAIGLGLLAAIPTGGSSLAAGLATAGTIGGVGLSAYGVVKSVQEFQAKSAAKYSALDLAKAISQEDPSLFWLAVDVVAGILDLGMAYKALKGIGRAYKAVEAGKGSLQQVEKEIAAWADAAVKEGKLTLDQKDAFVKRLRDHVTAHRAATLKAGEGAAPIRFAGWGELSPADVAVRLQTSVEDSQFMLDFYRRIGGWEEVKKLSDVVPDELFKRIHRARDREVARLWKQVEEEMLQGPHKELFQKHGLRLGNPYAGSGPGAEGYKGAFSDIDLVAWVGEGADKLTFSQRVSIELEAMQRMDAKLRDLVGDSGRYLDVNVYMKPRDLPASEVKGGRGSLTKAAERLDIAVIERERFATQMDYYEVRLGYGENVQGWNKMKQETLAKARLNEKAGTDVKAVERWFKEAEDRYAGYQRRIQQKMTAEGLSEGAARQKVRAEVEQRMKEFLERRGKVLDDPKMRGTPQYAAAVTEYHKLQLEMRAVWPEAYIGQPAARLGAAGKREAKAIAQSMSGPEGMRARLSQASMIVHWLGDGRHGEFVRAWKAGKYEMRSLDYLRDTLNYLPEQSREWTLFLKETKGAKTPTEAWGMWVRRFAGDETKATAEMLMYLEKLGKQTGNWLSTYFATPGMKGL